MAANASLAAGRGPTMPPVYHFIKLAGWGGLENVFTSLWAQQTGFRRLVNLDHDVHPMFREVAQPAELIRYKCFRGLPLPKYPGWMRALAFRDASRRGPVPAIGLLWNLLGFRVPRVPGLRMVHYDHSSVWKAKRTRSALHYLRSIDGAICCSAANARMLREYWAFEAPVHVCLNGLPPGAEIAPQPRRPASGRTLRIGAVGRLAPEKGLSLLLHALAELRRRGLDVELTIAGEGPQREALQSLAAALGQGKRVHFAGLIADPRSFYDSVDLVCCPSLYESFSLVCLEAAARGCPVVGANVGGIPEVIECGVTGVCIDATLPLSDYNSLGGDDSRLRDWMTCSDATGSIAPLRLVTPTALADGMERVLGDPALARSMSARALDRVTRLFTFEAYLQRMALALTSFVY